jgi:carboxypeptidase Taq
MPNSHAALLSRFADYNAITVATSLMHWDRQILMPPGGAAARTAQVSSLTRMAHELMTSEETQRLVEDAEREAQTDEERATARVLRRELDIKTKLPTELVERKSRVSSDAYEVWKKAKAESNFDLLAPYLQELFDIARETAERRGYQAHVYDPLIDLFEEGATQADAARMFESIKGPIVELVRAIKEQGRPVDDSMLHGDWDKPRLRDFAQRAAAVVGFDFERGRLDVANNAFCTNFSPSDVRMTTRPSDHLKGIVSSSLHEMGHGLYEQGSPQEWDRTPIVGGISLAVHESQSRMWENIVGRSRGFWKRFLPDLQATFPQLSTLDPEGMYRAINKVEPSFVRVGADELTYNLHILTRFELECDVLTRKTAVKDLPEAWNAKYTEYLGITPPNDGLGVLQDVHWSRGMVGYFPTYSMGNLISYQIWATLNGDIPNTEELMEAGEFKPILGWLQEKIYRKGKLYAPRELVTQVTGRPMEATDFLKGLTAKYSDIYGLS